METGITSADVGHNGRTIFDFLNRDEMKISNIESQSSSSGGSKPVTAAATSSTHGEKLASLEDAEAKLIATVERLNEGIVRNDCSRGSVALLRDLRLKLSQADAELRNIREK